MQSNIEYKFEGKMWKEDVPGAWCFISLPKDISKEIRENLQWQEEGWGRMKASVKIDKVEWETAIWFDTKADTYLLPVKAKIRKEAHLKFNETITIFISI